MTASDILRVVGPIAVGYLLGGIPFGVLVAKYLYRTDITHLGSGNTGATNVFRVLGWKAGLLAGIGDVAKGAAPTALALVVADPAWAPGASDWVAIAAGLAAVAGHSYSPYIKLRGGKGVATAAGLGLVLFPISTLLLVPVFAAVVAVTRVVSLGSLVVAFAFPIATWFFYGREHPAYVVVAAIVTVLVYWRHRSNIGRLLRGEEPRIDRSRLWFRRQRDSIGKDADVEGDS